MKVRHHQAVILIATLAAFGLGLSACSAGASTAAVRQTCQNVAAVLSDGPDPGADPIGYAEAQVIPLEQIGTSDSNLQDAIHSLASAYEDFYKTNGSATAKQKVTKANNQLNALCPGVA
jgi:hypothetical protein